MLLPGEEISFHISDNEIRILMEDEAINEKYRKGEVRIVTEQARYPLDTIPSMLSGDKYKLNPEFQRRHRWDRQKQSRLIESFIMNVPIPPIFLYEVRFNNFEVMDGLQRLTAIKEYYNDKFKLEGLEEWNELNGRTYSQLPVQVRSGIDRRYLSSIILLQETAKDDREAQRLKQLVFERINSGGVKLEAQESRNAIYNGSLNQLCIKLSRNKYLCKMWGIPEPDELELKKEVVSEKVLANEDYRKMKDVELVLRFFAFRQHLKFPQSKLKNFLDEYLRFGNNYPSNVLHGLSGIFEDTVSLVYNVLGENAFLLWRKRKGQGWGWYQQPALTAYDPIMHAFSQHLGKTESLIRNSDLIKKDLPMFYEENYMLFGGRSTTNISNILDRNMLFNQFINNYTS